MINKPSSSCLSLPSPIIAQDVALDEAALSRCPRYGRHREEGALPARPPLPLELGLITMLLTGGLLI